MILYRISGDVLRRFLEQVTVARDVIVAAAPVTSEGRFLDDGTHAADDEVWGIPVKVVTLDANSTESLRSDVDWAISDVANAPAIDIHGDWHVAPHTITLVAQILDSLRKLHTQVAAVIPQLGDKVALPSGLEGIVTGATTIPATLVSIEAWPFDDLPRALRALASLNYLCHRVDGHGKSWEPSFAIRRSGPQWHITFRTYQFDNAYTGGGEKVFAGTWGQVAEQIDEAIAKIAQHHDLTPSGGDLEVDHPLSRLSTRELLSLPYGVTLHLAPSSLTATSTVPGARNLLGRFDTGLDTRSLIEFIRYAVDTEPRSISVGAVLRWPVD
ncbi:MAG: hypothetical protein WCE30_05385 [Mycobacterium sp.]